MKKALIHDWIDQYGGAERVLAAISEIIDFDYYYVYVNTMSNTEVLKVFGHKKVQVVESNVLKRIRPIFRYLMPIFPLVVKLFNKQTRHNKVDLVVSSSWALSKSYRIGKETHICYLQARNFKYVWDESDQYFKGLRRLLSFTKTLLQRFDLKGSTNPNFLIANSQFVRNWVKEKYNRDSIVIYPPVDVEDFFLSEEKEDYFVTVGRLQPYKRFDIIVDAFNKNGKKLIIIGDGSVMPELQRRASKNIKFVGFKTKDEIKSLLSRAQAFVFAGVEDFGIAIVESLAAGTPVIAYQGGASMELINHSNGLVYEKQDSESLNDCIETFYRIKHRFNSASIRESAMRFSKARFQREFREYLEGVINKININENKISNIVNEEW